MYTLSQMVDVLVAETRRRDMLDSIVSYVNQTIREVHFDPKGGGAILFRDNLHESLLTATADYGYGWDIPDPMTFQAMQLVEYQSIGEYATEETPSRALRDKTYYYYRTAGRYNFAGYGGTNGLVAIAYYAYPKPLIYYASGSRPAIRTVDGWVYPAQTNTPELQAVARLAVSNWLLERWADVISEGVRAKIYKRVSDDTRAKTSYSLYMALRVGLMTSECADLGGRA